MEVGPPDRFDDVTHQNTMSAAQRAPPRPSAERPPAEQPPAVAEKFLEALDGYVEVMRHLAYPRPDRGIAFDDWVSMVMRPPPPPPFSQLDNPMKMAAAAAMRQFVRLMLAAASTAASTAQAPHTPDTSSHFHHPPTPRSRSGRPASTPCTTP
jgi:hypothetical protein